MNFILDLLGVYSGYLVFLLITAANLTLELVTIHSKYLKRLLLNAIALVVILLDDSARGE